ETGEFAEGIKNSYVRPRCSERFPSGWSRRGPTADAHASQRRRAHRELPRRHGPRSNTLARRSATEALKAYSGGCIEINLRGRAPGCRARPAPEHVHRRVLMMLNPETKLPSEPRALRKQYLDMLAEREVLLILDDIA
ncbi:MAG: hypothetical protein MUQ30_14550, partial [Anaerolineae bacterium]|nr:hypothetical protein [Anaerolineae bacterium]